jgi:hypothetical protein
LIYQWCKSDLMDVTLSHTGAPSNAKVYASRNYLK